MAITFTFCNDNVKECMMRNKFYNDIRKHLAKKKIREDLKEKSLCDN